MAKFFVQCAKQFVVTWTLLTLVLCVSSIQMDNPFIATAVKKRNYRQCSKRTDCKSRRNQWCLKLLQPYSFRGSLTTKCTYSQLETSSSSQCLCLRPPRQCSSSFDCSPGYRCVRSPFLDYRKICIHCTFVSLMENDPSISNEQRLVVIDNLAQCTPSPSPKPSMSDSNYNDGQSWMQCESSKNCSYHRFCAHSRLSSSPMDCNLNDDRPCFCRPRKEPKYCRTSAQCPTGDRCVQYTIDVPNSQKRYCVGCHYVESGIDVVPIDGADFNCYLS